MNNLHDRIKGALYGVAIGDALGAPLEFMDANSINAKHGVVTEMIGGGWLNVKPGEVTDDTQMTIAVIKGILEDPRNPVPTVGKHFIDWLSAGPKDVGNTCARAIRNAVTLWQRKDCLVSRYTWLIASERTDEEMGGRTAGNGALMRTIYPALYYQAGPMQMQVTEDIARMTHWSEESTEACKNYVREVHLMIHGCDCPIGIEYKGNKPTGYVIDSYAVASEAIRKTDTFEDALVWAVNQGGDADTIGAIAGGMAGAKYGYSNIPERWVEALDPDVREFLDMAADEAYEQQR